MKKVQDGRKYVKKSGLILTCIRKRNNKCGRCWNVTKMFSPGTKVNLAVTPLESMLWIHRGSHLAKYPLVDCPTRRRQK
jgi:hypothetical protein